MRKSRRPISRICAALAAAGAVFGLAVHAADFPGIGRAATTAEVAAWDIDVRADFKGLPAGAGSVRQGQDIWEARCASCHGTFGESNQVFMPLVGGTTAADMQTGHVANLRRDDYPARTTLMKVATLSTLWDYINRAMPWDQPKSLSPDEVYAVTAYLLHLGDIVPENFTLSDRNIRQVQEHMPNRKGMTTQHALWPGKEFGAHQPDTANTACMRNCSAGPVRVETLPEYARNAHGNLALQNRLVGAQHGADTSRPEGRLGDAPAARAVAMAPVATPSVPPAVQQLLQERACLACHGVDSKLIGPALTDVAKKHAGTSDAAAYLARKIREGGEGVWGSIPMPAQSLSPDEANTIAQWLATGAAR